MATGPCRMHMLMLMQLCNDFRFQVAVHDRSAVNHYRLAKRELCMRLIQV